jgi:hypothetical protein
VKNGEELPKPTTRTPKLRNIRHFVLHNFDEMNHTDQEATGKLDSSRRKLYSSMFQHFRQNITPAKGIK